MEVDYSLSNLISRDLSLALSFSGRLRRLNCILKIDFFYGLLVTFEIKVNPSISRLEDY